MATHRAMHETGISIHAPTRGATATTFKSVIQIPDFNPRSHKGSDGSQLDWEYESAISIHAPTRGATSRHHRQVFCHKFQSTLPQGERHNYAGKTAMIFGISIHAPTRGATKPTMHAPIITLHFNPRSHKGSD